MVFIPKRGTAQTLALALALRWEPLDPRDLLAFLIHPASPTGIPLKERIENAILGREALSAAAREELRLLYVGFTRARDY
jgi:ATP-dependent exoDNAse (exonuclease V) beta subunit